MVLYSYQILFINTGRGGYIIYALLMLTLLLQKLNKRQVILGILLLMGCYGLCYKLSPLMQERVVALYSDFLHYKQDKNTSVGFRIQFHKYANNLFKRHPFMGNGTGSFIYYFDKENPVPFWHDMHGYKHTKLLEPHSQYWLMAAEFGLTGFFIFTLFFASLVKGSFLLTTWRHPAIALLILIFIGNFSDSLLFYSGSGYFFIVLMALFLSEKYKAPNYYSDVLHTLPQADQTH